MAGRILAVSGAFLATFLAGCLEAPPVDPESLAHSHGHDMFDMGHFMMTAEKCEEGGFSALYTLTPGMKRAGVWELADVREEFGKPMRNGYGQPLTGPAMANVHQGFRCESATSNGVTQKTYIFGWIGNIIKPPAWDGGGADMHVLLAGFGFGNGSIADDLRATTTAGISHAYEPTQVTWYMPRDAPRSAVYEVYSDVEKGIYLSYSTISKYRDFPARTIRFWWQVPTDGSTEQAGHHHLEGGEGQQAEGNVTWHPVYWDMITRGGEQYTTPPLDSMEIACHMGTDDHGPAGGACQPTLTTVYEHKGLEIHSGKVFTDVVLKDIWLH